VANFLKRAQSLAIATSLSVPMVMSGQTLNDDQWKNVMHAQRGKDFQFTMHTRDLGCAAGAITSVTKQALTLKKKDKSKVTVARGDVLQLRELGWKPAAFIYSGRSSWSDVAEVRYYEFLLVVMRDGSRHEGQLLEATNSGIKLAESKSSPQISLLGDGKKPGSTALTIAKADVSEVYEATFKRMNSGADYLYSEMPIFWVLDPAIWPAVLDRGTLVLLYRARSEENNEPVVCSHEL
jgi:hypothetical protein